MISSTNMITSPMMDRTNDDDRIQSLIERMEDNLDSGRITQPQQAVYVSSISNNSLGPVIQENDLLEYNKYAQITHLSPEQPNDTPPPKSNNHSHTKDNHNKWPGKLGDLQWENRLAEAIHELESRSLVQNVTDIEDQWGVDPMELFVHRPTPTECDEEPLPLSQEGSLSPQNEQDWEDRNALEQMEMLTNIDDAATRVRAGCNIELPRTGDIVEETPMRHTLRTTEIRRSARLMSKSGPTTTADKTEYAAKKRGLEVPSESSSRQDTQNDGILGSIVIAEATYGREDIAILATAAGFRYSPSDYKTTSTIADRVAANANGGGPLFQ